MAKSSDQENRDETLVGGGNSNSNGSAGQPVHTEDDTNNHSKEGDQNTYADIEPTLDAIDRPSGRDSGEADDNDAPNQSSALEPDDSESAPSAVTIDSQPPTGKNEETRLGDSDADDEQQQGAPDTERTRAWKTEHSNKSPEPQAKAPDAGYEILDTLGRGGMGVVYKAKQKRLNRLVALKMIISGAHADPRELSRFQTEAEAVAKLTHPNIVQIYEVGESGGQPFFTLEYVSGGTLHEKFNGVPMKPADAAKLIQSLARAVYYAHQRDIIHRDLKPANVLLTEDGTPKISDFGLAKDLGVDSNQTGTGAIVGTPSYMAPEQARGEKDIGPLADVYALGAMFYEALTGRPPFRGESVMDTLQQAQRDDPVPPRRLQPKVPRDLETICLTCLRKEPQKRYASAEALADDIERFLNGQPIKARRVGVVEWVIKWAKRRPGVAALLGILAVVLVGGFVTVTSLWLRAESLRKQADSASKKANENALRADKNAAQAKINAKKANEQAKKASDAKELAQQRYHESLRSFYLVSMNLAQNAFEKGKKGRLGELLFHAKSGHEAMEKREWEKLQGFEFDYLKRLYQSDRLELKEHIMYATNVAFRPRHPDEFATASSSGTIIIWNSGATKNADKYRQLPGHTKPVRSVAYHPKQHLLASAGEDGLIHIWNLDDASPKPEALHGHSHWVTSVEFSPDGEWLVSGSEDRTVRLWDWRTGKVAATLTGHEYGVTQVAYGPRGRFVASAGLDKSVRIWDLQTNKATVVFKGHQHWVSAVAFGPARDLIASASWDKTVIVWDASTGQQLLTLDGCTKPARTLSFSPDGVRLAASCLDQSVVVWDLATKKLVRRLEAAPGTIRSVAFSEDGQRLASVNFDMLSQFVPSLPDADCSMLDVAFDKTGNRLAAAGDNHYVYLWDFAGSKMLKKMRGHTAPVRCIEFHPAGEQMASGGEDNQIILWNLNDDTEPQILQGHEKWVTSLAYGPGGDWLVSGSEDKTIRKWKIGGEAQVWKGHDAAVLAVAVSGDGKWIASGGADRKLLLWNADTGEKVILGDQADGLITAVAFSPDGKTLASAGSDNAVIVWDIESKKMIRVLRGHTQTVTCLAFHPNGRRLATGAKDRTVKIWDVNLGHETLTLIKHDYGVTAVAFRPEDGRTLVTAGWDQSIYLWQSKRDDTSDR